MEELPEPRSGGGSEEGSHWALLAQRYWSRPVKRARVQSDVIKNDVWDTLEDEQFSYRSLLELESLQLLEKYENIFQHKSHDC